MLEGTSAEIKVTFRPQQQDLKLLLNNSMKDVIEVAALSLVSGDEATRRRLRRLIFSQFLWLLQIKMGIFENLKI
jgi:hypothetical protein